MGDEGMSGIPPTGREDESGGYILVWYFENIFDLCNRK